jgi:hypothetical protein
VSSALHRRLLGPDPARRRASLALAAVVSVGTFVAYATGVFAVAGGVVFVPGHAALVALVAAAWAGVRRAGLAVAWLLAFAPFLGFRADWAFFGLASRPLAGQTAYLLQPEGLAVNAGFALVLGTVGFVAGRFLQWGLARLRAGSTPD